MIALKVQVDDQSIVATVAHIRQFEARLNDLRPYWPPVLVKVREVIARAFANEGTGTRAGRWHALSEDYARWKARHYPGKGIMERTGRLKESLTSGTADSVVTETRKALTIESRVAYGGYHQKGPPEAKHRRAPWDPADHDIFLISNALSLAMRRALEREMANTKSSFTGRLAGALR